MAKNQLSDVRGVAKAQRERERQEKKAEKLAKRREAREQRPEPDRAGQGAGRNREKIKIGRVRCSHFAVAGALAAMFSPPAMTELSVPTASSSNWMLNEP